MWLKCLILAFVCHLSVINCNKVGGFFPADDDDIEQVTPLLKDSLDELKGQADGAELKLVRIKTMHVQVVAGKLYKMDAEFENPGSKSKTNCEVKLWHQPWNGFRETKFKCDDAVKYKVTKRGRSKRDTLVGAPTAVSDDVIEELRRNISASFIQSQADGQKPLQLKKILDAKQKKVAGILYTVKTVVDSPDGEKTCTIEVWRKPWIDFHEVTVKCDGDTPFKVVHDSRPKRAALSRPMPDSYNDEINQHLDVNSDANHFIEFKHKFGRVYRNEAEESNRFRIFQNNLYLIRQLNKFEQGSAIYGVTEFADLTQAEYEKRTGLKPRTAEELENEIRNPLADIPDIELPTSVDWREHNAVTPVKNQASCGSCWAFSVTGNIEGLYAIKSGQLKSFSEQELVDCDDLDSGCNGGLPDNAVKFIEKEGGLEFESDYPYTAHRDKCHYNSSLSRVQVSGVIDFKHGDEDGMAKWLTQNGPISIGINANAMQFYRGGISHPWKMLCSKNSLDHGVLIVGFGVSEYPKFNKTLPYWIVKNSWGPRWGEQGYYRVYRGDNTCGVSSMASSAVLAKSTVY